MNAQISLIVVVFAQIGFKCRCLLNTSVEEFHQSMKEVRGHGEMEYHWERGKRRGQRQSDRHGSLIGWVRGYKLPELHQGGQ